MEYIRKIQKMFFWGGVEKEEYKMILANIHKENRALLRVFSLIASVMFFLLFIISVISGSFASVNGPTYLLSGIMMVLILICVQFFVPKNPALVMFLVYVFEIFLYMFGFIISMLHANKPAVSAVAFLLVSPLLFYDRPIRLSVLLAAVVAAFCVMVLHFKEPEVAETDIWNMITFGVVALFTTLFTMSVKIRSLAQSKRIEYLAQTDLLTGIKNRNYFERRLRVYPKMCKSNIFCVYGDVNGLHEMNNKEGHEEGDKMLREVASFMRRCFGEEHTYRIGGDEFVAFRTDAQAEAVFSDIEQIALELDEEGCHVAFGVAAQDRTQRDINMRELVKAAEDNMFSTKRDFYRRPEHNRRIR